MKRLLLFLLLATTWMQAQTLQNPTYGNTTTNTLKVKTPTTATSVNFIPTMEVDGTINKIAPINLPVPFAPVNYSIIGNTLGQQLDGIDKKLGAIGITTAGSTNRIHFTADNVTVTAGTFFLSSAIDRGTAAAGNPTALVLGDNVKAYFNKDVLSVPQATATIAPAGSYAGNLTITANPTPNTTQQRFSVEVYKTNNGGTPIASGIAGAPVGDLGVTVVAILTSGKVNVVANAISAVAVDGKLNAPLTINVGERLRYHVSAEKVGTGGGNVTFNVFYGTDYNSFYDAAVTPTTDGVVNKSAVGGLTTTNALDNLSINKENVSNKTIDFSVINNVKYPTTKAVDDAFTSNSEALKAYNGDKIFINTPKKAVFSFVWDDIQDSDLTVYNIFQEYGYIPSYALVTSSLNSSNKDLYIDLYKKGCSMIAHSVTHPNMSGTTLTNAQVNSEMVNSKLAMENYGMLVSGWVTPNSILNPLYYPQIDKNFGYGFTNNGGNFNETVSPLRLSRISLEEAMYGHNLANVKSIIDDAIANNKLIVFYAHHLPSTYLNVDSTPSLTESDLRDILAYLKTKTDENLCEVASTDEAIRLYYSYNSVTGTGSANYLPKWISNNSQSNSSIYDDGSSVTANNLFRVFGNINNPYSSSFTTSSIGNISSVNNIFGNDNNSSLTVFSANRTGGVNASIYSGVFASNIDHRSTYVVGRKIDATNWKESFRVTYNGNFLLNTDVDDGLSRLQINGGLSIIDATSGNSIRINRGTGGVLFASDNNSDAIAIYSKSGATLYQKWNSDGTVKFGSLTGTGTRNVAADANGNLVISGVQPLRYRALIGQSGTSAPTVTIVENSLSGAVVWTYASVGNYTGTLTGAFTPGKTFVSVNNPYQGGYNTAQYGNVNTVTVSTADTPSFTLANGKLNTAGGTMITIEVYP